MNEIISALERVNEKTLGLRTAVKLLPISSDALEYRAVYEMACSHLADTIHLFRHARKLKNERQADRKPGKGGSNASG